MKKTLFKFIALLGTLSLTACDFLAFLDPSKNQDNTKPDTPVVTPTVTGVSVELNKEYQIGDRYSNTDNVITATYSDGTSGELDTSYIKAAEITDPLGERHNKSSAFDRAGTYVLDYRVRIDSKNYNGKYNFSIKSGFETEGFVLQSLEFAINPFFRSEEVASDQLNNLQFLLHWNNGDEYYNYNKRKF